MNINKKFDRLKQWTNEKMGADARTGLSAEFKALEVEMNLRHEGMDKMQRAMSVYVKSMSKRAEGDDKEKQLPGGHLGSSMVTHGEDFEPDSEFGNCLSSLGRANERLARVQETYVASATTSWLEGLERSLAQMKEYQAARKKLEARRLAYDTSLAKMQKSKKEDFRMEEELRAQKAKYEETSEDVFRRMQDIKESEVEMVQDLTSFLEAELSYYDRCRELLVNVKRDWPVRDSAPIRPVRSRSNTAHGYADRFNPVEEEPEPEPERITIPKLSSRSRSPAPESSPGGYALRPTISRTSTYDSGANSQRDDTPTRRITRVPTDSSIVMASRGNLRSTRQANAFADDYEDEYSGSSNNRRDRSPPSPDRSSQASSVLSRAASWSQVDTGANGKKAPPPPPPSRAKKPPPPPPPMKRIQNPNPSPTGSPPGNRLDGPVQFGEDDKDRDKSVILGIR
ncbi:BAR-domain-containing protein [Dothidotthia symphoricarpi CBS 119687]|uniref:BAR-domain-containing protein n=1 Tax=Dothidotthia symphoricarpi CBS 119687 TaxID=1392245 RepID=A0A6A6AC08_9PLEO|nr:BAR-domain-containing protein [Dothidotthia symphoricarpi CBS 119687]KAF2128675.1 BAR-domain-containing protein [Dothidotthia symphoricarpi CBS 119687]